MVASRLIKHLYYFLFGRIVFPFLVGIPLISFLFNTFFFVFRFTVIKKNGLLVVISPVGEKEGQREGE